MAASKPNLHSGFTSAFQLWRNSELRALAVRRCCLESMVRSASSSCSSTSIHRAIGTLKAHHGQKRLVHISIDFCCVALIRASEFKTSWSAKAFHRIPMPPPTAPHMMTELSILSGHEATMKECQRIKHCLVSQIVLNCKPASLVEACEEKDRPMHLLLRSCLRCPGSKHHIPTDMMCNDMYEQGRCSGL